MTLKQIDRVKNRFPSFRVEPDKLNWDFDAMVDLVSRWARDKASTPILVFTSAAPDELASWQKQIGIEPAGILCERFLALIAAKFANDGFSQFIVAGGEITKAARNWLGNKLDASKRSQVMFMDRDDILNLFTVTNLPLPAGALPDEPPTGDEKPF